MELFDATNFRPSPRHDHCELPRAARRCSEMLGDARRPDSGVRLWKVGSCDKRGELERT